jgi:hypothetical protein
MKVKDLIEQLQSMNPEAIVIIVSDNFEMRGANVETRSVIESNEGLEIEETFRDAFDGRSYISETWSTIGGTEPVVKIS